MLVRELMNGCTAAIVRGSAETAVTDVTDDSRRVTRGSLFIAREGASHDGRQWIDDAVSRGAAAILTDPGWSGDTGGAVLIHADDVTDTMAHVAERFFGNPSQQLALVGITGTNGKTTTAYLVRHVLQASGRRCGLISTVAVDNGVHEQPATLTTPSAIEISRALKTMVDNRCTAAVMEVSSHALVQRRTAGLRFAAAVFTNLSGDHLDYHGTMEEYAAAKSLLFSSLGADVRAIVNADDVWAETMVGRTKARVVRTTMNHGDAEYRADVLSMTARSTRVRFSGSPGDHEFELPLIGRHNVANALQAGAVAHEIGVAADDIVVGLATCTAPPGRLELVSRADEAITVLVDYAHTDGALENVLAAVRPTVPAGARLCVVFGAGGDRDRTKRPRMAAAACRHADRIIVTSDNPRTEDPAAIIRDILAGVPTDAEQCVSTVPDRAEAIREAIITAAPADVIVIAGKGHEDYQIIGTERRPFDDRIEARNALDSLQCTAVPA